MTNLQPTRILYVETHDDTYEFMELLCRQEGFRVDRARTLEEAWTQAQSEEFNLFLLDFVLKDSFGLVLCRRFRERFPDVPIVIYTTYGSARDKNRVLAAGADAYYLKPYDPVALVRHISQLLAR